MATPRRERERSVTPQRDRAVPQEVEGFHRSNEASEMAFQPGLSRDALSELIGRANRSRGRATKAAMERILTDIARLEELGKKLNVRLEPERIAGQRKPPHPR